MKKYFFCFIIFSAGLMLNVTAQKNTDWEMKKLLPARVDSFINALMRSADLRKTGTENYSDEIAQTYSSFFLPDAKVYNEMAPALLDGDREHPFFSKFSSLSEYLAKVKANFPSGLRQNLIHYTVDYSKSNTGIVKVVMQKVVFGTSREGYQFRNSDTVSVEINTGNNYADLKISRILKSGSEFAILNDRDKDLIIDENDKCPDVAGLVSYQGCPPPTHPAAFFGLQLNFGLSVTTTVDGPTISDLGYDKIITQTFRMGTIAADNTQATHFGATIQYDRFFGDKKIFGGGIGISYQHFATELDLPDFFVEYHDIDKFGNSYRRRVESKSVIAENIKMNYLMVPLTLKYKQELFTKGGVYVDAGIAFSLLMSGSGKANTSFDYEAIYSLDQTSAFVYDNAATPGSTDWLMTTNFVNAHNNASATATDNYFTEHKNAGFDVAANQSVNQSSDFKLKPGMALIFGGGIFYKILENADAELGVLYINDSQNTDITSGYKITDKTGEYSSLVNGSKKITNQSIGVSLGLKFSLQ